MAPETASPEIFNDAFISYSRKDKAFAVAIEKALESYKPPRDLKVPQRHLVVFRDESDFTGVEYHGALAKHLGASAKLIVLCSPNARLSEFVNDEIRQFASLRGAANIIPVLVYGIPNNEAGPGQEQDKAFPEALVQTMTMPLASSYLGFDLQRDKISKGSFAGSWYKLLGDIYGVSRSEVEQRDKKREARRRWITAGVTGSVIVILSVALVFALISRRQAVERGEIALARQLAAQSEVLRIESPNLLDRSVLLAVEAARRTSGLEIDRSLRAAVGLLPDLLSEYAGSQPVQAVALGPRGDWAAAGGDDGIVRVWERPSGKETARIEHGAAVQSIVVTPDGRTLASASGKGTIVHDMKSGQQLRLSAPGASVLAFGGGLLASGGAKDGRIGLWDVASGREVRRLQLNGPAAAMAFSPDHRLLAAGGAGNTLQVWDVTTGREFMRGRHQRASASMPLRLGWRDGGIFAVAFHPNGKHVASGGQDRAVSLWEIASGREVFRGYQSDSIYGVAISPDGRWLASGGMDETARVWSLEDGSERHRLQHKYVVQKVLWTAGGDLLTVSGDGTSRLWSMSTGRELSRMYHANYIHDAAISADGRLVITGDWNGMVRIWGLSGGGGAVLGLAHPETRDARYSPDGTRLVTIGETNFAQLWQLPEGKALFRFRHEPFVSVASFSPDGKILVTAGWDGMAQLWDVATAKPLATLRHRGRITDARFSPDGRTVVTAGFEDGSAGVWEVPSGRELFRLRHEGASGRLARSYPQGGVRAIAFDAGGRTLATGGHDGTVRLWNLADGRELRRFEHRGYVLRALFTPDDRYLVADSEKEVCVWLLSTGKRIGTIDKDAAKDEFMSVLGVSPDGRLLLTSSFEENSVQVRAMPGLEIVARLLHDDDVFSGVFSKDGSTLLTASRDKTARAWDTRSWREITRVSAGDFMYRASYSPDEKFFVTASGDGQAQVWAAGLEAMVDTACRRLRRDLTQEESRQYLGAGHAAPTCRRQPS